MNKVESAAAEAKDVLRKTYYYGLRTLPLAYRRRLLYLKGTSTWPNFRQPKKFTEKVNWRILNDRRGILEKTCDKEAMKVQALQLAGDLVAVPRMVWHGTDLHDLIGMDLPEKWVLKPNHRAGRVHFGQGAIGSVVDLEALTQDWLEELNGSVFGEWAYTKARKSIILEEFIGTTETAPSDYKVYVFDGRAHLIQYHDGRFSNHSCTYYGRDWKPLPVKNMAYDLAPHSPAPAGLEDMLVAAERIASGFDFLRVDFYFIEGTIWFGEVAPYPAGGISLFEPSGFDRRLGAEWKLPDLTKSSSNGNKAW